MKKLTVCLVATVLTLGCCLGARAQEEDLGLLYEGLFESFGGEELQEVIPQEAQELLPEDAATSPSGLMEALSLRNIVNVASGGLYQIIRSCLQDFSRLILVVLLVVLAGALSDAFHAEFAAPAIRICAMLGVAVATYSILSDSLTRCEGAIENATTLLEVVIPVLTAAGLAAGRTLSSLLLPVSVSTGITVFASFNSRVFLPLMQIYFALALAASVSGAASLKSLCKVFHKTVVFAMGFATTLMAGLLSLQKIVGASADNIATDAAKFALGSVIPVVGSILTDALGTVLGCIKALRGSVGVVGIFVLLTLMLPVAVRVLLQTQLCRLAGALSELFGESSVTEFLESVAAVWSMLAALTVCQGVYFIAATALMAT